MDAASSVTGVEEQLQWSVWSAGDITGHCCWWWPDADAVLPSNWLASYSLPTVGNDSALSTTTVRTVHTYYFQHSQ